MILIKEETVNSESDFQDVQTYAVFDDDDKVIIRESSLSHQFNYQEKIQCKEILESDNLLIKEIPLVIDIKDLR